MIPKDFQRRAVCVVLFTDCHSNINCFKPTKHRESKWWFFFFYNMMDVTRGQRDINLHVISKTVIEWIQKWHAVACCFRVMRLSSGVCISTHACVSECKTSSVAAGVKVAQAVNSTHSFILSHFLSHSFFFFSSDLVLHCCTLLICICS